MQKAVWIQKIIRLPYIMNLSYLNTKGNAAECAVSLRSCAFAAANDEIYVNQL